MSRDLDYQATQRERAAKRRAKKKQHPVPGDKWTACTDRLPDYGDTVWCYWCARRDGVGGMQGVAVRGIHMPNVGAGDMTAADYWHAEGDRSDTRFEPLAWRPLPAPPPHPGRSENNQ